MKEDKVIVKAHTKVVFTFEEHGHLTMKEIRDKVREQMEKCDNVKVKDIKVQMPFEENGVK